MKYVPFVRLRDRLAQIGRLKEDALSVGDRREAGVGRESGEREKKDRQERENARRSHR